MATQKYTHSAYWMGKKAAERALRECEGDAASNVLRGAPAHGAVLRYSAVCGEPGRGEAGCAETVRIKPMRDAAVGSKKGLGSKGCSEALRAKKGRTKRRSKKRFDHKLGMCELSFTSEYLNIAGHKLKRRNINNSYDFLCANAGLVFVNPLMFAFCLAADIGVAIKRDIELIADPDYRAEVKRDLLLELKKLRRPFYYARENEKRRSLAKARRKISRRTTLSPKPTPEALQKAWDHRKDSKEAMIRLGGMLQDLECFVDNCLKFDDGGKVVGRNHGIRGYLAENLPDLLPKYKTLMRYKAMAIKLRQATGTRDPTPTVRLLREPINPVVNEILRDKRLSFASIIDILDKHLSPDRIFDG